MNHESFLTAVKANMASKRLLATSQFSPDGVVFPRITVLLTLLCLTYLGCNEFTFRCS